MICEFQYVSLTHLSHLRIYHEENTLSSSYDSIRDKSYINFVLAKTIHFILNIEKKVSL